MKSYNPAKPLIHIHIPKTGGVSVQEHYRQWFGDDLLLNYYDSVNGRMPERHDLDRLANNGQGVCIYGHFNQSRHFGIADYYPEVDQFITILRDPFERVVSGYFYTRKNGFKWKDQSIIPECDLRAHLLEDQRGSGMFNHFPEPITFENYRDVIETRFIEVGLLEYLDESMKRIAMKLNKRYVPSSMPRFNATARSDEVPYDLRAEFKEANPLAYAVYDYVLARYLA